MKRRTVILGVVALLALPVVLAAVAAAGFYAVMSGYAANRISGRIVSSGQQREYLLHVPAELDRARPAPLVISLHGAALWPATEREASGWDRLADREGFIVAYPSGTTLGGKGTGMFPFRVWLAEPGTIVETDSRFIADLIDTLSARYAIDPARVYLDGLSNGGGMAFALSCTLPERIAAIGMVAAAHALTWSWCSDTVPVPVIAFHGTADPLVPYEGAAPGLLNPRPFPDIPGFMAQWARRNRCEAAPADSAVAPAVERRSYHGCAGGAAVVLYTIQDGGHQWPGGKPFPGWLAGAMPRDLDATGIMWEFYRGHTRRRE